MTCPVRTVVRQGRRARVLLVLSVMCAAPAVTFAQASTWSGTVALDSQLVDRGQAMSPETPMLQGAVAWSGASGWSVGLSSATEVRAPSRVAEVLGRVSYGWRLSPDWQMQGGLSYYDYPGSAKLPSYNRAEANLVGLYRDVWTLGLSAIRTFQSGDNRVRWAADAGFRWPLPAHFAFTASAGYAQSLATLYRHYGAASHYGEYSYPRSTIHAYAYGHVGLAWNLGAWRIELDRIIIQADKRKQWGDLAASPWLGTIAWSF